ncbi:MAG: CNNM domain-containing protein [Bacteroidota bacterium]
MDTPEEPPPAHLIEFIAFDTSLYSDTLDPVTLGLQVIGMVLGLVLSALFSGSEVAFFSLSNRMNELDEGAPGSQAVDRRISGMLEKPRRLLATILIGNTFSNIITSVLAAVITGNLVAFFGASEVLVFTVEVLVLTFTILILSEITPKIIAINNPLKIARRFCYFIYAFFIGLKPIASIIAASTINLEKYLPKPANRITSEDIRTMAEVSEQDGSIKEDEREIIENVIEFGTTVVREIMTSRVNLIAVSIEDSLPEVIAKIQQHSLSRMPLYENDLDTIVGVIYSKDVLPYMDKISEMVTLNWRTIARTPLFIPATKKLDDLLRDFQQAKTHLAVVVDEYGGTEGIVTMDDILEEIVGDITDESSPDEEKLYTRFRSGIYIFDAQIDLDDMEEVLETEITSEEDEFETLGGLIYHMTENLPNVGERVHYKGLELTVHSVQNNRIKKVRVKVDTPQKEELKNE